jgi:hypothetical protein
MCRQKDALLHRTDMCREAQVMWIWTLSALGSKVEHSATVWFVVCTAFFSP